MDEELARHTRRFLLRVVPHASAELRALRRLAEQIPDSPLRREALASITAKDFHVHGGCILATFLQRAQAHEYVALVAAFETAVDYLDNLCDRTGSHDEEDFRALHEALVDAVTPNATPRSYFRCRSTDDGGYLEGLVRRSQASFSRLTAFSAVAPYIRDVTDRYCELQALKHLRAGDREVRCQRAFASISPQLQWWEGAAACGSTLPTFALAYAATRDCTPGEAADLHEAYFPRISAFHILLDYFIDQREDREHGELNFVACYPCALAARDGISQIGARALDAARSLRDADRHAFAVRAMCAFYCSMPKIAQQNLDDDAAAIASSVEVELPPDGAGFGGRLLAPLLALYRRASTT